MRRLRDGRWKLNRSEEVALIADPAFRKASALVMLWGGASGGDRNHPEVVKASLALKKSIDAFVRKRMPRRKP